MRRSFSARLLTVWFVGLLASISLLTSPAFAAQTGNIAGLISGPDGTPLQGATVTLEGPNMIGKRTESTFDDGRYRFVEVPPGTYAITIEATGYLTRTVPNVLVNLSRTTEVNLVMQLPESAMQEITITDSKPTIDVTQTHSGEVIDKEFLSKLPVASDPLNVSRLVPGVIGTGNAQVNGAGTNENQFLVDGVNITDPVTNTFSANFNFNSIEQVEVQTGAFLPENQGLGGLFNYVTKSGGNEFSGGFMTEYSDDVGIPVPFTGLFGDTMYAVHSPRREHRCARYTEGYSPTGNDLRDQENCEEIVEFSERGTKFQSNTTDLWLGGPIIRDKVWFFTSYRFAQSLAKSYRVEAPRNYTGHYYDAKITWQPVSRQKITFKFQTDPTLITRIYQDPYTPEEGELNQRQGGQLYALEHQWFVTDRVVLNNRLALKTQVIDVVPFTGDFSTPGRIGTFGAQSTENAPIFSFNRRQRLQYDPKATYYLDDFFGNHQISVGGNFAVLQQRQLEGSPGNLYFYDRLEDPYNETSQTMEYYWVETSGPIRQDTRGLETGLYVQDVWQPFDKLTVSGGLRFDRAGLFNDQDREVISFWALSPRIYAAYDLTGDGKTVIKGGYGRFIDPGKLSLSDFLNRHGEGYKLFLGDYFYGASPGNVAGNHYAGTFGEATTLRAGNVRAPTEDSIKLGVERDVIGGVAMGVTWNAGWTRYLFEDDDANLIWNGDGTQTIGNRMGVIDNRWRIRTPAAARRYYQNVEFTVRRRFADGLEILGSYTWSRNVGTTSTQYTAALDNPPQTKYDFGYLGDRTHVVRLSAAYDFSYGLTVGTVLNYVSGARYERRYWNDWNNGYTNRRESRLTGGQISGAPLWDIKFAYGPKLPGRLGRTRAELTIENVMNNRQITSIQQGPYNSRGVKYPGGRQGPISFRLGARYEF